MTIQELVAYLRLRRGIEAKVVTETAPDGRAYGRFVVSGEPWPKETTFAIRANGNVFDLAFFKSYKGAVIKACDAVIYANLPPNERRAKGYGPASLVPATTGGHATYTKTIDLLDTRLRNQGTISTIERHSASTAPMQPDTGRAIVLDKPVVTAHSGADRSLACQRLAGVMRRLAEAHRARLAELKRDARDLERADFIWRSLVESFSSMGNSRGYQGLFGDPRKYEEITFEALSRLPASERQRVLSKTLAAGKVRMPDRKAAWLLTNFERIAKLGGPAATKSKLLARQGREAKIEFLKTFDGIGDKYARNIFMNVFHPDFRQSIAVDARIQSISNALKLKFNKYEAEESFYLEVAERAGLSGWEVDRLIYWYKDEVLKALDCCATKAST